MRELNSVKAEEMMKTKEFLIFKDRLIEYLRSFVKCLQMNVTAIEQSLKKVKPETEKYILEEVTAYEMSIPRIEMERDEQQIYERMAGRLENIPNWFVGINGIDSEAIKVFDTTNEIIRKITRYATRLSEQVNSGANRREEYRKLAEMFARCKDIEEAHKLSSVVFGIEKPIHFKGDFVRETESINSGVYDEKPQEVTVTPRIRNYREKTKRSGVIDRTAEKDAVRRAMVERLARERELLESYIKDGRLEFSELPVITPQVRDVFLGWLSKGLESKSQRAKTERYIVLNWNIRKKPAPWTARTGRSVCRHTVLFLSRIPVFRKERGK